MIDKKILHDFKFNLHVNWHHASILLLNKTTLMKKLFLSLLVIAIASLATAQEGIKIDGTIIDNAGVPLPGVTIRIKGANAGTITDVYGRYQLSVPSESTVLVFSYIGYETQERLVGDSRNFDITLFPSTTAIDEVVVIGYGEQKRESVVAAISQVRGSDLQKMGVPNVSSALSGTTPGLNVISSSGMPGEETADIYIRGRSSLNNSQALILVDGVEITGDFSNIDPNEIESISILKDASATAVYGVKGANGVIIITTKRGRVSKPLMSFMGETTIKEPTRFPALLGSYGALELSNVAYKNDERWVQVVPEEELLKYKNNVNPYLYPNVNWYDEAVKNFALSERANFTIQGGTEFIKYFGALNYLNEGDIFETEKVADYDPGFNFKRYNFRTNLDFNISKTTTFSVNLSGRLERRRRPNQTDEQQQRRIFDLLYTLPPHYFPVSYPADIYEDFPDPDHPDDIGERMADINLVEIWNPIQRLNQIGYIQETGSLITADFVLDQDLSMITEGLSFLGRFSYSSDFSYFRDYDYSVVSYHLHKDGTWEIIGDPDSQDNVLRVYDNESLSGFNHSIYYRLQLGYNRDFGNHSVSAMGLASRRNLQWGSASGLNFPRYQEDWVVRVTYNFGNRYFLEGNGAYNGSERFAPGKRFGFFPSGAIGWNIANEQFLNDVAPWIDLLKVRYSLGQVGSEAGADRWMYEGEYTNGTKFYQFGVNFYDQGGTLVESKIANPAATWETATKENVGFELGVFDNMINATVDLYRENRDGIFISPRKIPPYFGSSVDPPKANIAATKSKGIEVTLNFSNTIGTDFRYFLKGGFSFNDTRVTYQDDPDLLDEHLKRAGKPIGVNQVYLTDGMYQNIDEVVNSPNTIFPASTTGDLRYVDYNADGTIDQQDQIFYGYSSVPRKEFSFQIGGNYQGFNFQFLISGARDYMAESSSGGSLYIFPFFRGYENARPEHYDYWTADNPDAQFPTLHIDLNNANNTSNSYTLQDLSYIRLKNVDVGYAFTSRILEKVGIRSFRAYVSGNNLLTFSKLQFGDPEGGNTGGSGHASYPLLRRYNIGFNITF